MNPVTTWHLLQVNPKNAVFKKTYWFPTPEDPEDPRHHAPSQHRILKEEQISRIIKKHCNDT